MDLTFIGSGDAFGSGGRFNTCFMVSASGGRFLIDCGATSLVALRHHGVDPNSIDGVVLTHLHGDHFGGLPFLLLDAQLPSRRRHPFFVMGPPGTGERLERTREALFPGSASVPLRFSLAVIEIEAGVRSLGRGFAVTPFPADHSAGAPCFSLRIECDERIIAYSGDTAWTDALAAAGRGADLFICECSSYERPLKGHIDYKALRPRLAGIGAKRVILTHMNPDMLARRGEIDCETAHDGLTIAL